MSTMIGISELQVKDMNFNALLKSDLCKISEINHGYFNQQTATRVLLHAYHIRTSYNKKIVAIGGVLQI